MVAPTTTTLTYTTPEHKQQPLRKDLLWLIQQPWITEANRTFIFTAPEINLAKTQAMMALSMALIALLVVVLVMGARIPQRLWGGFKLLKCKKRAPVTKLTDQREVNQDLSTNNPFKEKKRAKKEAKEAALIAKIAKQFRPLIVEPPPPPTFSLSIPSSKTPTPGSKSPSILQTEATVHTSNRNSSTDFPQSMENPNFFIL